MAFSQIHFLKVNYNEKPPTISVWSGVLRFFRRNVYEDKNL